MGEGVFRGVLLRERRRMERSDRSFALLLVAVDQKVSDDPLLVWGPIVEALRAIKAAAPFPPIPAWIKPNPLPIELSMIYEDRRLNYRFNR